MSWLFILMGYFLVELGYLLRSENSTETSTKIFFLAVRSSLLSMGIWSVWK